VQAYWNVKRLEHQTQGRLLFATLVLDGLVGIQAGNGQLPFFRCEQTIGSWFSGDGEQQDDTDDGRDDS
jgi:hypothetical protein